MKKTLLAVAIPSLLVANMASAAEIYKSDEGSVDFYGQLRTELKKSEDKEVTLNAGSSRAGVAAQYTLAEGVDVFGKVEFGLQGKGDYVMKNRLHIAGVATDFGKFSFGRQWVVSDDVWGADYSYFFGGTGLRHATLSGARHDSLIKYNYEGESFWVAANYGLDQDDSNQELAELYAGTSIAGFNLHVGGGQNTAKKFKVGSDKTDPNAPKDITADLRNTYFEGTAEYSFGAALIGFTYYNAKLEDLNSADQIKENAYSLAGTYAFTDKATAYTGFEYVEQKPSGGADNEKGDGKNFYLGTVYKFNSWARIYGEYGYAKGTTTGFTNKGSDSFVGPTAVKDGESNFAIGARVYW
ncbi:porin [Photobacterium swingsii]|uniref:porin n=1 Tax=Photobacterium swingsii TaxID=680026 RepID=UPI0040676395